MRILIAGGAGCLGSNLTEHWYPRGHEIMILDNFATGRRELVPQLPRLELVEGTIANRDLVHRAFENFRPTHVVHAAAAYKDPTDWREDVETNVLGTINLIEAARAIGATRFVNFQTVLCYGRRCAKPDSGGLSACAVHELRHFESGRRAIPCGQRPQLDLAAARQCHRPTPRYRAHSDVLQTS